MKRHEYALWGAKALAVRGEALPHARLNADTVRTIRANPLGLTARELASRYGVHYRTIEKVRHYETWGHVA
jgi:hypothetical protein